MELCLGDLNQECLLIYLDNVIIFFSTFAEQLQRMEWRLEEHGLKLKPQKCHLFRESIVPQPLGVPRLCTANGDQSLCLTWLGHPAFLFGINWLLLEAYQGLCRCSGAPLHSAVGGGGGKNAPVQGVWVERGNQTRIPGIEADADECSCTSVRQLWSALRATNEWESERTCGYPGCTRTSDCLR